MRDQPSFAPLTDEETPSLAEIRRAPYDAVADEAGGFWVFGYGSLMWNPGFAYAERRHAVLPGYARRFCLWSVRYRGTPASPGLVLGLARDPAAETRGVAFRVTDAAAAEAWTYLAERELSTAAYHEVAAPLRFCAADGSPGPGRRALAYVCDQEHRQFARGLSLEAQAQIIAQSRGARGENAEYLFNTVAHLAAIGVEDPELQRLEALVRGEGAAPAAHPGPFLGPEDPVGD